MRDAPAIWDARCLMCEALIGQVIGAKLVHNPSCTLPLRVAGGRLRCCRCGGTLYREPASEPMAERPPEWPARVAKQSKYGR